jgi:AraC-like DNA-binding protein
MRDVHYHPWWGLDRVAKKYRLSLSRLYHLVTAGCGQGARKWREDACLTVAAHCLYKGCAPKEIYGVCGFATVQSFSRAFKRYWGKPPVAYQRWAQEVKDPYIVFDLPGRRLPRSDYEKYGIVELEVPPLSEEKKRELAQRILDSKVSLQPERIREIIKDFVAENGKDFS